MSRGRRAHGLFWLLLVLSLGLALPAASAPSERGTICQKKKTKKKKKSKKKGSKAADKKAEDEEAELRKLEESVEEAELDEAPVDRRKSKLTPDTASRWSNQGAMEPIESEVPVQAPLPARALPKSAGVETPGQSLMDDANLFSAHVSLSASHLETVRQDDRDIDLLRAQLQMDYTRIGGTELGVHTDLAYWPKLSENTSRPTTYRVNALYLSYGLSDFRQTTGPSYGIALGRVAVPEAAWAIADGAAFRYRFVPGVQAGVFGGFAPNPYRYNWAKKETEEFSFEHITAGLFGSFHFGRVYANIAGVLYYATGSDLILADGTVTQYSGLDRIYSFLDFAWSITDELDLFANGWIDFGSVDATFSQQLIQNLEATLSWRPTRDWDFRLSGGRFATAMYGQSVVPTFGPLDPNVDAPVVVDENGTPITPYDAAVQRAIYNRIRLRAGHRILDVLEPYVLLDTLLRDTSDVPITLPFSTLRLQVHGGVLYRDPKILDAAVRLTGIVDEQAVNHFVVQGEVGREWYGLRLDLDGRAFVGETNAYDFGLGLGYTLPREWLPGRLMFRGMLRYFRENVALERALLDLEIVPDDQLLPIIPVQESFYGFVGIDWRL